ncbi:MAG: allophanate hydrolase [Hyphomicrobiaceae bacterium TMED74]|nr:allophanate hydrolase [Filomicrobium sp.]RPG48504.1 MAG: allophanate hydrolase [Hyphomicrobiaceae bacterium TMED74]
MPDTRFDLANLKNAYINGAKVTEVIQEAYDRIAADNRPGVWISLRPIEKAMEIAASLEQQSPASLRLFGVPFAAKDNIDVADLETTAGCPAYAYRPERSARVVERLEAAGAICIGKTNLDQFATGLNGTRSPFGACASAFDTSMVSGGSSSGSAVAVALQHVAFALGTDTGGSGRIPAGLNNVVGLKPTVGALSSTGLVPCCRTLDCPSVFALSVDDALEIAALAFEPDVSDPSLRPSFSGNPFRSAKLQSKKAVLAPRKMDLEFFGNDEGLKLYQEALARFDRLGFEIIEIDFQPLVEAGTALFDGPWVAERYAAIGEFLAAHSDDVLETTRSIVKNGARWSSVDLFARRYRLREIRADLHTQFERADALIVPTVAPLYSIAEMQADPIVLNNQHGHYSYFANLLDLSGLSIPAGFHQAGMPFGITLLAPALQEASLASLAAQFLEGSAKCFGKLRA